MISSGSRTPEEFHYAYDQQGRLYEATFAQTPSNLTPDSSGYYDGYEAQTRARAHYEYDGAGRLTWLGHYWDTLGSGSTYTSQAIVGQSCDYELSTTAPSRGVKVDAVYKVATAPGSANWAVSQTETYSYDSALDYLNAATYGDALANANPTWSYDAAGNRNDAVTDNLNRATSLGGAVVTNDILGKRLSAGASTFAWDILSRMTSWSSSSGTTNYIYRADGMRVSKSSSQGSTSYRYDGQMEMEDIDYAPSGSVSKVSDYGIGPRGIDTIYVTQNGSSSAIYPIYDAHGNMISTLSKQGTGAYSFSALRTYDAWGNIRRGAAGGDPKGRYCANLGHKQDDESGLIYMRARYYEPTSGRFITEDLGRQGLNWMAYCANNPIGLVDTSGNSYSINNGQRSFYKDWYNATMVCIVAAIFISATGNLTAFVFALTAACMCAAAALSATSMTPATAMWYQSPSFLSLAIGMYAGIKKLDSDGITMALAAVVSLNLAFDIAALAEVNS